MATSFSARQQVIKGKKGTERDIFAYKTDSKGKAMLQTKRLESRTDYRQEDDGQIAQSSKSDWSFKKSNECKLFYDKLTNAEWVAFEPSNAAALPESLHI